MNSTGGFLFDNKKDKCKEDRKKIIKNDRKKYIKRKDYLYIYKKIDKKSLLSILPININ